MGPEAEAEQTLSLCRTQPDLCSSPALFPHSPALSGAVFPVILAGRHHGAAARGCDCCDFTCSWPLHTLSAPRTSGADATPCHLYTQVLFSGGLTPARSVWLGSFQCQLQSPLFKGARRPPRPRPPRPRQPQSHAAAPCVSAHAQPLHTRRRSQRRTNLACSKVRCPVSPHLPISALDPPWPCLAHSPHAILVASACRSSDTGCFSGLTSLLKEGTLAAHRSKHHRRACPLPAQASCSRPGLEVRTNAPLSLCVPDSLTAAGRFPHL